MKTGQNLLCLDTRPSSCTCQSSSYRGDHRTGPVCAVSGVARCFGVTARTAGDQTFLMDSSRSARWAEGCTLALLTADPYTRPTALPTYAHTLMMPYGFSRSCLIASITVLLCSVAKVVLIHQDNPEGINSHRRQILSLITSLWIFISGSSPSPAIFSMPPLSIKGGGCSCVVTQSQSGESLEEGLCCSILLQRGYMTIVSWSWGQTEDYHQNWSVLMATSISSFMAVGVRTPKFLL